MKRHASMNRTYRLVWSLVLDAWTAVAENARARGKGTARKLLGVALLLSASLAHASPSGGQVTAGQGTITQSGSATTITQASQQLSLRWDGFNTAAGETVNFVQPSASAVAVNRIFDTNGTRFLGNLNANGQVYLINPNGILFGAGSQVNVGGLVASTLDIGDAGLSSATRSFSGTGTGSVVNQGTINGRYVALLGNTVRNQGTITTAQGMTALGAGSAVTLTFADTSLVRMQVDQSTLDNLAENGGLIRADGGMVLLTAGAKNALLASVVNNTGVIEARSVQNVGGTIVLDGGGSGTVTNSGTLDASGKNVGETGGTVKALGRQVELLAGTNIDVSGDAGGGTALIGGNYQGKGPEQNATTTTIANGVSINADAITSGGGGMIVAWSDGHTSVDGSFSARGGAEGGNGGQVETSGHKLTIGDNTRVSTLAPKGQAGNWLLDPVDFTIYGAAESGDMLDTTLNTALASGSVTIQTGTSMTCSGVTCGAGSAGNGDIFVTDNAFISWTTANTLTLSAYRNINLVSTTAGASFDASGGPGNIVLRADNTGTGTGTVNVGNQAYIATSGGSTTIYYNPVSYSDAVPSNYKADGSYRFGTFNVKQLVRANNASPAVTRTYDGTTTIASAPTFSLAGTPTGATLNVGSASFADKNAGTGKTINYSGYSASGTNTDTNGFTYGYELAAQPTATGTINKAAITVSGITASNKTYDATISATVNTAGAVFTGKVGGDTVTVSTTGTFSDKNVGTGKTVSLSSSYGGADATNYTFTDQATTTANITPASLTVSGVTADNKTYDTAVAATLSGTATVSALGSDAVTVGGTASASFANKNVGTGKAVTVSGYTLGGADAGNYTIVQPTGLTANITQANLAVTGVTAGNKIYDGTTAATLGGTATVTALGSDVVSVGGTGSGSFADKNVGTGKTVTVSGYTLGGADAGNYSVGQPTGLTANITPAAITVSGITASNRTYDGSTSATLNTAGAAFSGKLGGDTVTVSATASFADKNVGISKTVTLSGATYGGADAGNYIFTDQASTSADITAKAVTVSGITASNKTYDGTTAATVNTASAAFTGKVAGDTLTVSATGTFADKDVGTSKTVNLSGASYGGADAGNYTYTDQASTTADITAKALTLSGITADNKVYDGGISATLNTAGVTFTGLVGGDTVSLGGAGVGSFGDKNVGTGKAVTVSGYTLGGADAGNYSVGQPTGLTANITPAAITVSGITASNKTYDGGTSATVNTAGASFTGMVGGDALTVSATGAFADKNVGTSKTVNLSSSYGGADAGNYSFTDQASTTADITAKSVTLTAPSVSKTYDGGTGYAATAGDLTALAGSLLGGDTVTAATIAYTDKNAGTNKTVNLSAATINDGNGGSNYSVTLAGNSTSTITAKGLSVAANAASKTFDGLAYSGGNGVTYSGFAAGDTAGTVLSGTLSYGGTSQGAVNPGTFTIIPGGLTSNANYSLSFVDGALTILEAAAPAAALVPAPAPPPQPQTVKDATTSLVAAASQPGISGPSQTLTVKQLTGASAGEGGGSSTDSGGGNDPESAPGNGIGINTQMARGGLGPILQIVNGGIRLPGNMVSISE